MRVLPTICCLLCWFNCISSSIKEDNTYYVFYLHGQIVEVQGANAYHEQYGKYEYHKIVEALEGKGLKVISEMRAAQTDHRVYAEKVAEQIRDLVKEGVSPRQITVLGGSKGSVIAMLVSTILQNHELNFVLMVGCNDYTESAFSPKLCGRILSIYETTDEIGKSCQPIFEAPGCTLTTKEIALSTGTGHGLIYKPMPEWIDPAVEWIKGQQ